MSIGRPSDYKPDYCEMIIRHMEQGKSLTSFAAKVDVSRNSIYEWAKKHPEFYDAIKIAQSKSRAWWEEQGDQGLWEVTEYSGNGKPLKTRKLNAAVWIFTMKSRFGLSDQPKNQEVNADDESFETEMGELKKKYESER